MLLQQASDGFAAGFLVDLVLPLMLAGLMFSLGMSLRIAHFRSLLVAPRGLVAGIAGQLVLLPVVAVLVVESWVSLGTPSREWLVGLLLMASMPGGATSNMLTWIARGDSALSVSLTAFSSVTSFLFTPLVFFATTTFVFGAGDAVSIALADIMLLTLMIVAGPVVVGMWVGHRWPQIPRRVDGPARVAGVVFMLVIAVLVTWENRNQLGALVWGVAPALMALNLFAMGAGLAVGRFLALGDRARRSVIIEVGFQNGSFALIIALSQLNAPEAAAMTVLYTIIMFATGGAMAWWWTRRGGAGFVSSG